MKIKGREITLSIWFAIIGSIIGIFLHLINVGFQLNNPSLFFALLSNIGEFGVIGFIIGFIADLFFKKYKTE